MNCSLHRVFGVMALAGLIGAGSMRASVQGSFHLPVMAHWGNKVLLPGDYQVSVMAPNAGPKQVVVRGEGNTVYATALAVDSEFPLTHGSLQLVERNGAYFVKQYRSGVEGKIYTFGLPKAHAPQQSKSVELAN
jgi:hypothetical protein